MTAADLPVRALAVEVRTGLSVTVLAVEPDALLAAALVDSAIDPYSGVLWPAALAAARALAEQVRPGQRVVEIGAGNGLAALTAARLGARALALDHSPLSLRLVEQAARQQGLTVETRLFDLAGAEPLPPLDVLVAADLLYEEPLARQVARRAVEVVRSGGAVLVADPGRSFRAAFGESLSQAGVAVRFRDVVVDDPERHVPRTVGLAWLRP